MSRPTWDGLFQWTLRFQWKLSVEYTIDRLKLSVQREEERLKMCGERERIFDIRVKRKREQWGDRGEGRSSIRTEGFINHRSIDRSIDPE